MPANPDERTIERVSRAVWSVVADRGIEGVSVREVAESARCTTGLIMHHFGSRNAMLVHARRLMFGRTTQRANHAEDTSAVPAHRLERVLSGALTLDEDRRHEAHVWIGFAAAAAANPELRRVHVEGNRDWLARITRLLGQAAPQAAAAELGAAAVRLVALADGLAVLSVLDPQTYDAPTQEGALIGAIASAIRDLEGRE